MPNRFVTFAPASVGSYGGAVVHAAPGAHELMMSRIESLVPAVGTILDVGAGSGALAQRLSEAGYAVQALDRDPSKWSIAGVPFSVLDIDRGMRQSIDGYFDAVVCLEVVEHLENPWHLFRECHELVRPGGYLFISTPNVTSFYSRFLFLVRGRFHQFKSADLEYGHINPVTSFELETIAARTGWETVSLEPAGYLPILDFSRKTLNSIVINVGRLGAYIVARGLKRGWCVAMVFRRSA